MAAALTFLQAAEESYVSLKELVEKSRSTDLPDSHKKREILQYLVKTQQPLLRLNVLAKWCQQGIQQATTKLIITPTDFHMQIKNPKDICNTEPGLQRIPNPCHRAEPKDCFPKP
nr:mediator of RNA polymerase II transcription subunit 14 [Ipomoea batatas]